MALVAEISECAWWEGETLSSVQSVQTGLGRSQPLPSTHSPVLYRSPLVACTVQGAPASANAAAGEPAEVKDASSQPANGATGAHCVPAVKVIHHVHRMLSQPWC